MLNEIFSDYFACRDNYLTRIDSRIKMIFVFGAILAVIFSHVPQVPVIVFLFSLAFLMSIRVPFKIIIFRLLAPLSMAAVIIGIHLIFYRQNLPAAFLIAGKVAGSVSLVIFLSMTTPANALFRACLWFKIPQIWVEIAAITYRYVFVLIEDAIIIKDAQNVRLGYSNLPRSLQSLAELTGSVFIRAYDQSVSTCEAMKMRGYAGTVKVSFEGRLRPEDAFFIVLFSLVIFLLIILNVNY